MAASSVSERSAASGLEIRLANLFSLESLLTVTERTFFPASSDLLVDVTSG
jgi:hypothetical protein